MSFGLCHVKAEGKPAHPEDVFIHCGCAKCEKRFIKQAKLYFKWCRESGASEEELKKESYYQGPND